MSTTQDDAARQLADIDLTPPAFLRRTKPHSELTEAGEQYVIPGAEKKAPEDGKPYQPGLFE